MKLSCYGNETSPSHAVRLDLDLTLAVEGQDVIVVEDIVDTGTTTAWLLEHLHRQNPASIRLCARLDMPARCQAPVRFDYLGFTAPGRFIVGYGIDWAEEYRQLDYIGTLPNEGDGKGERI